MSMFPTTTTNVLTPGSTQSQQQEDEGGLPAQLLQLEPDLCSLAQLERIFCLASLCDGPLQQLARIMVDGLVRRRLGTINRALIHPYCQRSVRTARCSFIKLLPFLKMAYVAINRVILDDMENEKFVHIIDLSGPAAHWWQWLKLMRAFRQRPEGPPADLRITMVHDDGEFLAAASARLRKEADSLNMAFTFHGFFLCRRLETLLDLGADDLHAALAVKFGYARALSCALQMCRLLEVDAAATWPPGASSSNFVHYARERTMMKTNLHSDPSPTTPLSPLLSPPTPSPPPLTRFLRALSLKVLAVVEQEVNNHNHNAPDFTARFRDLLHYYAALFDALEDDDAAAAAPGGAERRHHKMQTQEVEQVVLGEEIRDALVRGAAAEPFRQWAAARTEEGAGGLGPVPLSWVAKMEADEVLRKRKVRGYENRGREHGGVPENCLLLCRGGRPLYAVSAWRPRSTAASEVASSSAFASVVPLPRQIPSTWTWPQQQAQQLRFTTSPVDHRMQ
ncbi:hypothetical protein QOZ80_5BG0427860 [Eleusine coracana subsp. coracana]|nr:hypothetical protein QOZ80_5BG0427860 [Eleusine coracana subsp. coracana]